MKALCEPTGNARAWLLRLLFVLTFSIASHCPAQQLSLQEFGQADGLRDLAVTALAQDAAGFVWAGTQNGLYRFDGARYQRVGLADGLTSVTSLLVDAERLWISSAEGLWLWQDGHLRHLQSLTSDYPQNLARAPGGIWMVDDGRLHLLTSASDGTWQRHEPASGAKAVDTGRADAVSSVVSSPDGSRWFGCGHRLCFAQDTHAVTWGPAQGVPKDTWHWLLLASDGSVWARGSRHVLQLPPGGSAFVERTDRRDLADSLGLYPLAEDAQHRIVGASRGVLARWNGHRWSRFERSSGLPSGGRITALLSDREGGLWMGLLGAGVLRWRGYGRWENWSVANGLPHDVVWRLARAGQTGSGVLLAGTGLGVAALDDASGRFVPSPTAAGSEVNGLTSDRQGITWIGTSSGQLLAWRPDKPARPVRYSLAGAHAVWQTFVSSVGEFWVLTDRGLFRRKSDAVEGAALEHMEVPHDGDADVGFYSACEAPDGSLWFGGAKGVTRYFHDRWEQPWHSSALVLALTCLRDGSILASSGGGGIHRLVPTGPTVRDVDATPPLLRGLSVLAVLEDRRGWWWIASDAGLAVGDGKSWRMLDQAEGLVWNDTSNGALFEDRDGSIWVGTSRGLSHFLDPTSLFSPASSKLIMSGLRIGGRPLPVGSATKFGWSSEALEIDLAMPAYRDRSILQPEYRLIGLDDKWVKMEHLDVQLTALPPGKYRFEARAIDRDLGTPSASTGIDIEIVPPWWRTPAALALWATLAGMAAWGLLRWRMHRHVAHQRELEAIVAERTKELEASREQLRDLATKDGLTGVWNRRALDEILAREASRSGRERTPLVIAICDIDHFKKVNDTYGHATGDQVLREFAARLTVSVRPYDAVGRYGGEEFVIVMPGLDVRQADQHARLVSIHEAIANAPMASGTVTCSFGVAATDGSECVDVATLMASADAALYEAKRSGRNRICWSRQPEALA
ncbi:MAG: diguanylate cyclase [Betaproteobacteria bacterium]